MTTAPTTPALADDSQRGSHSVQRLVREFVDARLNDCMNVMAEYPDAHFDLAIVDPPYGIGINMNQGRRKGDVVKHARKKWDDQCPEESYWHELRRVSKNQIVWGANNYPWLPPHNGWIVWDKDITGDVPFSKCELAYCSQIKTVQKVTIRAQSGDETYTNKIHPTQKLVKLYDWLLANYAKPGQRILDTHMGSGSIGIACHYYRCPLVACEIDPDYFRAACDRIERETAQADWYLPNAEVSEGGTRDSRIETAAQSRPSLH